MTRTLQGKLRKAKLLHTASVKASAREAEKVAGIEKALAESEEKVVRLQMNHRVCGADLLNSLIPGF